MKISFTDLTISFLKIEMYSDTAFVYRNKAFEPYIIIDVETHVLHRNARTNSSVTWYIIHNFLTPQKLYLEWGDYIYFLEFYYQPDDSENEGFLQIIFKKWIISEHFLDPEKGLINELDGGPKDWYFFWNTTEKESISCNF